MGALNSPFHDRTAVSMAATAAAAAWSFVLLATLCLVSGDDEACGSSRPRIITAANGAFDSPGFPDTNYPNNADCQWRLSAPDPNARVRLEFEEFVTEARYDTCNIYDGVDASATRLASLSGTPRSQSFESSDRSLYVVFDTDGSVTARGFKGKFTTDIACFEGEERVVTDREGTLTSPYYPEEYGYNMNCTWKVQGGASDLVVMSFEDFELEFEPDCRWDYLELYDADTLVGRFCGNSTPPDYISSSNEMTVFFSMDQSIIRDGFSANYQIVPSSSTPSISTQATTPSGDSSTIPTAPPVDDDIIPPVAIVALNGTYRTDDGSDITQVCADEFALALRTRATEMLLYLYEVGYCANTDIYLATADTVGYVSGDTGRVKFDFNLLSGLNDSPAGLQSCGEAILDFTTTFSNWQQPIIPQFAGCPKVVFEPETFDSLGTEFACPFVF